MRPTLSFDTTLLFPDKPFVLTLPTDHEPMVVYLDPVQLAELVAEGDAEGQLWKQSNCRHQLNLRWAVTLDTDRLTGDCMWCGLEVVIEADGTVVPVDRGSAT
ncbi:MAG TPA: hypothetical protein VK611_24970 [Acidimicrobiales bacterium]|nr:hypothetical protein [Acidimicrobiales bacterium]